MEGGVVIGKYFTNFIKFIVFILLLLLLILFIFYPSIVHSLPNTVTVGPYINNYKTLNDALNAVADGGTIYILYKSTPYLFENIEIDKNVTIIGTEGWNGNLPIISCSETSLPFIIVDSPYTLQLKNLKFQSSYDKTIIESKTSSLLIDNVSFKYSYPIIIKSPTIDSPLNITIKNSHFEINMPQIDLSTQVNGTITFENNSFSGDSLKIKNYECDINITNNTFSNSGIIVNPDSNGLVEVNGNTLGGSRLTIKSFSSKDIEFKLNKMLSSNIYIYNYDLNNTLYINQNWWGSSNGPSDCTSLVVEGNVDYSNWALDENFISFSDEVPKIYYKISGKSTLKNSFSHNNIKVDLLYDNNIYKTTYTDSQGYFTITDVEPNLYNLRFEYQNYQTVTQQVYVNNKDLIVDIELPYITSLFDLNNDSQVTTEDLNFLCNSFGLTSSDANFNPRYDLNRNDKIDILDLLMILRYKGDI
ncbi:hypothetical protein TR13x_05040 [Caloranaerobacter sp. TR13]|uniref:carboxypeptidase regulatory-like domain-containing protein n=1 Tax=Caloranaerobacter sp. TR13 TaxID=1302151 RepID=UPI0006D3C07F|nr:carboxypeptidase regulatory-like domain-containing protein [Caloranaerobacter sp. TR13]KPU27438.1 hypothetical protein TR13x_05040 [Caloranaerobacter sp. TR13]